MINKVVFEDLSIQAGYLANTALVISTAMFDSDLESSECEGTMRYFTELIMSFSRQMQAAMNKAEN